MKSLQNLLAGLPDAPGVYLFKDHAGEVIYVGKATSLKRRVASYWQLHRRGVRPIEQMRNEVADIETRETGTVIEALILEASLIKKYWPRYNVMQRDDKSFLYVAVTRDEFPRVLLVRGLEVSRAHETDHRYQAIFGPFTSARSIRTALDIMRKIFPWSDCEPPHKNKPIRACFYEHLGLCPGVCTGRITARAYRRIIRKLILFFQGKRIQLITHMRREMDAHARREDFESARAVRDQLQSLEHIQDIALLQREDPHTASSFPYPRIEAYDISNISGMSAVGSMTVAENGVIAPNQYRKFRIKTVRGANDTAMMREVLSRRFRHREWRMPDLLVIDGGVPQVNAARMALAMYDLTIPLMGIAKGPTRKRDEFVYTARDAKLTQFLRLYPHVVKRVRDEAHRFAVKYHRALRATRI